MEKVDAHKCAKEIYNAFGEKNIVEHRQCATRIVIMAAHADKVNSYALSSAYGVKGVFKSNGYFDIVIGASDVTNVYNELHNIINASSSDSREPSIIMCCTSKCDLTSKPDYKCNSKCDNNDPIHEQKRTDNKQTAPIKRNSMTLYDMLDKTLCAQRVWIFESNAHDQNMPIYRGNVGDARCSIRVWDYLLCEVTHYEYTDGILDIRVRNEYYEKTFEEGSYSMYAERWKKNPDKIPWLYSSEIESEKQHEIVSKH